MGGVDDLVRRIDATADCVVLPPVTAQVVLPSELELPEDLVEFYRVCGGVKLFQGSAYSADILSPNELQPTNLAMLGKQFDDDPSASWFTIAALPNGDFISIDLDRERLGRCYDGSHENHGVVGSCAIVALSFTDLLTQLVDARGGYWFWLEDSFAELGDAYD